MKVTLNSKEWEVVKDRVSVTMDGQCVHSRNEIHVYNHVRGRDRSETYVHEFLHALFPASSEKVIKRAAKELTEALCKCEIKFKRTKADQLAK